MKLLILTPYIPYPINSGGNQVFFSIVDKLRKYIDISIVLMVKDSDAEKIKALRSLWENVDIYTYNKNTYRSQTGNSFYYNLLKKIKRSVDRKLNRRSVNDSVDIVRKHSTLASSLSNVHDFIEEGYVNFISDIVNKHKFDLIQVEFYELIGLVNALPIAIKKVFIHHELRYVRQKCEMDILEQIKPIDYYAYNCSKNYEIQSLNSYDVVVTLTEVDKEKLEKELKPDVVIVASPAIVDIKDRNIDKKFKFNNQLVFLGGSDHFPNLDAIDWFLNNCWEEILKTKPDLKLNIIGRWSSKYIKLYTSRFQNVFFKGFVEDLSLELTDSIMIVPIRIGSGVRIKILDALSYGTPLVTTSVGCEGVGLINEQNCLIADDQIAFTNAILKLTKDDHLCNVFRNNAKIELNSRPSVDQLVKIRLDIYKSILSN